MPRIDNPQDPYATPHAPKERGGPLLRVAIIALLLAGAGAGWAYFSDQPSQGLVPSIEEEAAIEQPVQVADAGSGVAPTTTTDATATDSVDPASEASPDLQPSEPQ